MEIFRTAGRAMALIAVVVTVTFGVTIASAAAAGAQLEPITDQIPGGDDAPDEEAPDDDGGSGLPEELDPILDPILEQFPGDDDEAPEDDGSTGGDGSFSDDPSGSPDSGTGTASTLPQTGGVAMVGAACVAAAGGLALRRLLPR